MFIDVLQSLSSFILWLWTNALPQPVMALFNYGILALLLFGGFRLLWSLI